MTVCLWCGHKDVDFICSSCVQLLCRCNQEKLRELQKQCEAKGYDTKVKALKSFIGELEEYVPKTSKTRSDMVRKGSLRQVRPARHEIRA